MRSTAAEASAELGAVRFEWAHDGDQLWVLQLHAVAPTATQILVPGDVGNWLDFDPADGLDVLRQRIAEARAAHLGIEVIALLGITSHVGDLLRHAAVPARIREEP